MNSEQNAAQKIMATWWVSLDADCPHCKERVNLMDAADFWEGKQFHIGEHMTERTRGLEVICPECEKEFAVDLEY